jgi:hypothetical protein
VYNLVGNKTLSTDGSLYSIINNSSTVLSLFENFFINTSSKYEPVLNSIHYDPNGEANNKKLYNIPSCLNILTSNTIGISIKESLKVDLSKFFNVLEKIIDSRGIYWKNLLDIVNDYIYTNISDVETTQFPTILWNDSDGFISFMSSEITSLDRMAIFIFRYYVQYDINKLLPVVFSFVPEFTIINKNPIEYVILTFLENITRYIHYQNEIVDDINKLTEQEELTIINKIIHIGYAYLDYGIQNYDIFTIHDTNILETIVPELFAVDAEPFSDYHSPYDGITSLLCYLLNQMKPIYNTHYQTITEQSIYDEMGNPFMTANEQFITSSDFYTYGGQMYNEGVNIINTMINTYLNDMTKYDKYGNLLKIKNLYLEQSRYTYTYPIEMYIEMHKAIYNNQNLYIGTSDTTYEEVYDNILTLWNEYLIPFLQYLNVSNNMYISPMDVLCDTTENRLQTLLVNPYNIDTDYERYLWYEEKIKQNILNNETFFDPVEVGIISYFISSINETSNPFEYDMNLYNWYEGINRAKIDTEIIKMNELFSLPYYSTNTNTQNAISPQNLYGDIGNINYKYNSFANITDFIKYLMDHIFILSSLGNIIQLFKSTIESTSENLINYYTLEKNASLDLINKINPYVYEISYNNYINYSELEKIIRDIYESKNVDFAWIREIGHYIIDTIDLYIDDAIIDHLTGEYLHFMYKTEITESKKSGYDKMIGNVPSLYTFNNTKKCKYTLYVPIPFTFSKFYEASIPLICMNHADMSVRVKLKNFNDVAYYPDLIQFNRKPKLKCSMIGNYLYIEHEDRMNVAKEKQEILMETIQYNGETLIDLNTTDTITIELNFCTLSKELFIACRLDEYTDGSQANGEKKWNNYLVKIPKNIVSSFGSLNVTYEEINPIDTNQIKYNGREREATKESVYFECIQKYQHHTCGDNDGINVYSFALYPELLQPTGNANLGRIGTVELIIKFKDDIVQYVRDAKKTMHINVYNKGINILRIMSGLAGLAYFE